MKHTLDGAVLAQNIRVLVYRCAGSADGTHVENGEGDTNNRYCTPRHCSNKMPLTEPFDRASPCQYFCVGVIQIW